MSPREVIDIHREMTQAYHDPRHLANVAFAMLASLLLISAVFLIGAIPEDKPSSVGMPSPPASFDGDDSFPAWQRRGT